MSQRSPFLPSADAPLHPRLVLGWGLFVVFVVVGLGLVLRYGWAAPILLEVTSR